MESTMAEAGPRDAERRPSLVDAAYAALKAAIRDNVFPPGFQGSEGEMAARLGMSRTPVHEAVIRLQEDGLVRVLPKRGVSVCPLSPEDVREIYDVLIALEGAAAELLARLADGERRAVAGELGAATAGMEAGLRAGDLPGWATADDLFHRTLVERCGNGRIRRIARTVTDQAHRARTVTLRLRPTPVGSAAAHRRIVEAIAGGDPDGARRAASGHRVSARDELVPLIVGSGIRHL